MPTGDAAPIDPAADDDLLSALEVIEQQPLPSRAAAYEALVDALARQLESAPPPE